MADFSLSNSLFSFRFHDSIHTIGATSWGALAKPGDPFLSYAFLACLEDSGSIAPERGWQASHVAMYDPDGAIIGVAPLYLKTHSRGEFVFDDGWAEAYERTLGAYYPKWQVCVPFSPVNGSRLMVGDAIPPATQRDYRLALVQGMIEQAVERNLSSIHVTFLTDEDRMILEESGLMTRIGYQFHWLNPGYRDFDDFLAALTSRKRKLIRRERREANAGDWEICYLRGRDIKEKDWQDFYALYLDTIERKWSLAYLTKGFFCRLSQALGERVLMIAARDDQGNLMAAALNLIGSDALYGRYWGARQSAKFLHFELCYYRALDFAITHQLARVEAGAQGIHKIQRGYLPVETYSSHWIAHPGFAEAIQEFLVAEKAVVAAQMDQMRQMTPYRTP